MEDKSCSSVHLDSTWLDMAAIEDQSEAQVHVRSLCSQNGFWFRLCRSLKRTFTLMRNLKNKAFASYMERKLIHFTTLHYSLLQDLQQPQRAKLQQPAYPCPPQNISELPCRPIFNETFH